MENQNNKIPDIIPITELVDSNSMLKSIIKVVGVGGGGGNALIHMFSQGIENVDFVIANTDIQVLEKSGIPIKIQLGRTLTEGLGAGNDPERGKNAAIESKNEITEILKDRTKMVFITAGMGGGTGTGAAPVIAQIAKELGILTVGIVTLPFRYEGSKRIEQAKKGLMELKEHVDALIVIDNEKINEIYGDLEFTEALHKADDILATATKGIAEIITKPGIVNVDFADVNSVLRSSGVALMGTGMGKGKDRAEQAVKLAITSPLLNNNDIRGAKHILVNIISPKRSQMTGTELQTINSFLQNKAGNNANLIWGATIDESLEDDKLVVTAVATGFKDNILESFEILKSKNLEVTTIYETPIIENNDKNSTDKISPEMEIIKSIKELDKKDFNYLDSETIDNYEKIPAYLRQNKSININAKSRKNDKPNNNLNSFINPMMD